MNKKGITLIALIITIIVMLILVAIVISLALRGGLFGYAGNSVHDTKQAIDDETELGYGDFKVGGKTIDEWVYSNNDSGLNVRTHRSSGKNRWSSTIRFDLAKELSFDQKKEQLIEKCGCSSFDEVLYDHFEFENEEEYRTVIEEDYEGNEEEILNDMLNSEGCSIYQDEFTQEQKKEIVAYILEYPDYNSLKTWMDANSFLQKMSLNEADFIDFVIENDSKFINYDNVTKLKSLGVVVFKVTTPTNVLYTTNLDGEIFYSVNKNGDYYFTIECDGELKSQTVTIDNIREKNTIAPYSVKLESFSNDILYSIDNNSWQTLNKQAIVNTSDKIYLKFKNEPSGTGANGLHFVEKDDTFYKYYNDEEQNQWLTLRSEFMTNNAIFSTQHSTYEMPLKLVYGQKIEKQFTLYDVDFHPCTLSFLKEAYEKYGDNIKNYKICGSSNDYPEDLATKYPALSLGHDNVIKWYGDYYNEQGEVTNSPVYELNVNRDINLLMFVEYWD